MRLEKMATQWAVETWRRVRTGEVSHNHALALADALTPEMREALRTMVDVAVDEGRVTPRVRFVALALDFNLYESL